MAGYDVERLRGDFPILSRELYHRPLVYLDNTATSQTPRQVVEAIEHGYYHTKANVHRGVHTLSMEATDLLEEARTRVAQFINSPTPEQVIFTRGTTEAINLVAATFGAQRLTSPDDELILTVMEHHSNIVPWQLLQPKVPFKIRVVPILENGELDMETYRSLFNSHTRMAAFCHASNVLGTVNPVAQMVQIAHSHGVPCLIDGAQAAPHIPIDVQALDADFYCFSAHKMYGPVGVGVLYGRKELLEQMPPYQGGGDMIDHVSFQHTTFASLPFKFEAGTPDFVGVAAMKTAIDYISAIGLEAIARHEHNLLISATDRMLSEVPGMTIYGSAPGKTAIISFNIGRAHNYDVGMLLDKMGIAVRTGHHCAQPLMAALGVPGVARASFALYNTEHEVDLLLNALKRIAPMLA